MTVDDRRQRAARQLRRGLMGPRRRGLTQEQHDELRPLDDAVLAAQAVVYAVERRRMHLDRAAEDGSAPFLRAVTAERKRLDVELRQAERAVHAAKVAANRVERRIEHANRDGCADCP
jgi:hypothetical protein